MQFIVKILFVSLFAFNVNKPVPIEAPTEVDIYQLWIDCRLADEVSFNLFRTAILGYQRIENIARENILTIIDFSKPSTEKRFFVIDLKNKELLYKCYVAHGKNSGENYAKHFSNQPGSLQSCLGLFLTAETYTGSNGYSLRLDGLERGKNDNARDREIVIHGAAYVSQEFISRYGRLGRSWGCPVIPLENLKEMIDFISSGSCLFIYSEDNQ
jgi:hypothetical protein